MFARPLARPPVPCPPARALSPVAPPAVVLAPRSGPLPPVVVTTALPPVVVVAAPPAAAPVPRPRAVPPPPARPGPGPRPRAVSRRRRRQRLAVGAHDHVLQRGGRRGRAPRRRRGRDGGGVLGAAHDAEDAADVFRSGKDLLRRPAEALEHAARVFGSGEARLLFIAHLALVRQRGKSAVRLYSAVELIPFRLVARHRPVLLAQLCLSCVSGLAVAAAAWGAARSMCVVAGAQWSTNWPASCSCATTATNLPQALSGSETLGIREDDSENSPRDLLGGGSDLFTTH